MLELVVGRNSPGAPTTALWVSVPAVAFLVLPLFARRRFPFAAPGGLLAAGRGAHVLRRTADPVHRQPRGRRVGDRVPAREPAGRWQAGIGLGNRSRLHRDRRRRTSPARSRPATSSSFRSGSSSPGSLATPCASVSEQAEAAEDARDPRAEREREAREHATSARMPSRGAGADRARAPRHRRPRSERDGPPGRRRPARAATSRSRRTGKRSGGVERAGRTALAEMRRLLGAMRSDGDAVELGPQPGLDGLDSLLAEVSRAGLPVRAARGRRAIPAARRRSTSPRIASCKKD